MAGRLGQFAITWAAVVVLSLLESVPLQARVTKELAPLLTAGTLEASDKTAVLLLAKALRELRGEAVPAHGPRALVRTYAVGPH
jgi:hypothetical protein